MASATVRIIPAGFPNPSSCYMFLKGKSKFENAASGGNLYLRFTRIKDIASHVIRHLEILCSRFYTLYHKKNLTIICPVPLLRLKERYLENKLKKKKRLGSLDAGLNSFELFLKYF